MDQSSHARSVSSVRSRIMNILNNKEIMPLQSNKTRAGLEGVKAISALRRKDGAKAS